MANFKLLKGGHGRAELDRDMMDSSRTWPTTAQAMTAWRPLAGPCPRGTGRKKGQTNVEPGRPLRLKGPFCSTYSGHHVFFQHNRAWALATYPSLGAQVAHSAYCLMICKGQTWWRGRAGTSWVISKILQYPLPLHF